MSIVVLPATCQTPAAAPSSVWSNLLLADAHGAMGRKRLITDSFQVVKKRKRDSKEVKAAQDPPCDTKTDQAEALPQDAVQQEEVAMLRQFDLSWEFGPCTGITRLQRWERAELLGLEPPATVRELLLKYKGDPSVMHSQIYDFFVSLLQTKQHLAKEQSQNWKLRRLQSLVEP